MTLCVYALTSAGRIGPAAMVRIRGMQGERLHLLGRGPVRAVAGELRRAPAASPEALRRYDRTVRALAASLPVLLPTRFGTCFTDPAELDYVLSSRGASFRRALAHVRGRVQMTVRVFGSEPKARREEAPVAATAGRPARTPSATKTSTPPGPGGAGRRYLQDRAEASARERQVPGFEAVRRAVATLVRDERVERHEALATVYHLVPRASAEAYRDRIMRAATAEGLQIVVSGPWPPYAFAREWTQ